MKQSIELITPKAAAEFLDNGVKNRRLKTAKVKEYIEDISKGDWGMTGEPIIFDDKGRLLDGRNRLTACVRAAKSFKTAVVRGVASTEFARIDSGASRSAADVLNADGFTQDKSIAAAVKVIDAITRLEKGGNSKSSIRWGRRMQNQEVLNFARRNKKRLVEGAGVVRNTKDARKMLAPNGLFVALFFMFAKRGGLTNTRAFFDDMIKGEKLDAGDPILRIRKYLFDIKGEKGHSYQEVAGTVIKGWNSRIKGKPLKALAYDKDTEAWPVIAKQ